ncbi:tyrosine-type recombinase/integrase [Verrucomicrobiaceae bacterium N1E253]|uniref:Tyrosine-type recombinase/integrase n=1 Tax=Oceaniferula marina TaxID=2748318 RepID=A0A851GIL4_9BACT|nr:tyrosine-type recombinase/integrase [Oceaniferula marina]NWK54967.1 tyrosine-type recombinase/integrase [Oceaniferula marina]
MNNKVSVLKSRKKNFPWYVSYPDGGKRKKKYFKKKERKGGADEWAKKKRNELKDMGSRHASITETELQAVINFREAISELPEHAQEVTLVDAVASFVEGLKNRHKSITCQEVTDSLKNKLLTEGKSKGHRDTLGYRLKRFNASYGDWLACDITTEIIDDFLTNLEMAQQTQLHYRRAIGQMFNHAIILKAATSNPVTHALRPKVNAIETGILKPQEVASLLSHADDDTLPGLAISFFAGIRRAEIERLDWSEIDLDERLIEIKAAKAKTAQRRHVPIGDNLASWLIPYKKHKGPVIKSHAIWRKGQQQAREDAKLESWPHNAGRHSFASYHLAHHNDPGKLAMALGHPDPRLLYKHYHKLVTPKTAALYWSITPEEAKNIIKLKTA